MMANHLLGGGGNSRLWKRIRETEGLSYDVRASIAWSSFEPNSAWKLSAIFAPQNRAKVGPALREEVARALKDGFTQQELSEGKPGCSAFAACHARRTAAGRALADNLYLDRTFAYRARSMPIWPRYAVEQVNAALRKYMRPDEFVFVFAGDFKAAEAGARSLPSAAPVAGAPRPGAAGEPAAGAAAPRAATAGAR